jgi:hemoglobin-like flavoprotein
VDVNKEARSQNRVPGENTMEISESLEQILDATDLFGESFYELFLSTYPEVQEYFEGVNMSRQAVMLTMALTIVEQHATSQYPATKKYLRHLGETHYERGIPEELYEQWRDAMLETLYQFHGDQWDLQLATQWREAIEGAIKVMFQGYQRSVKVAVS